MFAMQCGQPKAIGPTLPRKYCNVKSPAFNVSNPAVRGAAA